ncbi:MAG TPA: hypothetical protein VEP92_06915 [Gaiellaceae bacterium]|nr:hypothetical protein [Gaiellaceae bacterium]
MDEHDDHHFTLEPDNEDAGAWSTHEEERTFRSVRDLLMEMRERGSGIYIRPVREDDAYGVDGWVVGEYSADGAKDLAVGPWLEQVVEAARTAAG